jgi:hypothetical protein
MQAVGFTALTCRAVTCRVDLVARSWTALLPCQRQLSIHRIPTPHLNRPKCRSRPQVRDRYSETAKSVWLAGAGGFEPPNGGIKIRCLTTWLRPIGAGIAPARRAVRRRRNIIGGFLPINDCGGKCQFGRSIRRINSTCLCTASAHCHVLVTFTIISFEGAVSEISLTAARPNQTVEGTCPTRLW